MVDGSNYLKVSETFATKNAVSDFQTLGSTMYRITVGA